MKFNKRQQLFFPGIGVTGYTEKKETEKCFSEEEVC